MAAVQFLGASVTGFQCNIGWGTSPTTLNVSLVEDTRINPVDGNPRDTFTRPLPGTPAVFTFETFTFRGIVQNWRESRSTSGNPVFDVNIIDPREVLEGVQIIVGNCNNEIGGLPNIINVYGYLENQSFGSARSDETGMPYDKIAGTVQTLTFLDPQSPYGGAIAYRGTRYGLDLSQLPTLPSDYRIGGDTNLTLMDFINEVCDAASHDFFFKLEQGLIPYLKLYTISRKTAANIGKISEFITQNPQYIASEVGLENVNSETGKFLVGGQVHEMYYQPQSGLDADATIWPFWGQKDDKSVILGTGVNNDHEVTLPCLNLRVPGIGDTYQTNVGELRAALDARHSWEFYLTRFDDDENSIHYQKATKLGITGAVAVTKMLQGKNIRPAEAIPDVVIGEPGTFDHEYNIGLIYEFIKQYADQFYGKKFMVRIPDVKTADPIYGDQLQLSRRPVDSAFIAETDWPTAISKNLLPLNVDPLYTDEGKIVAYVKFDDADKLDFSEVSVDDIVFSANGKTAFIKCEVEPDVFFLNYNTKSSPRAVITLSGPVRLLAGNDYGGNLRDFFKDKAPTEDHKVYMSRVGGDHFLFGEKGQAILPTAASVPLENTQKTYGPWSSYGGQGKMAFERDDSLVPWNFGGDYTVMNQVAGARVNEVAANLTVMENGSIEYPGAPTIDIGDALIASGPYITNIGVTVGTDGIKTNYRMEIWTPRYGKIAKNYTDRITKFAQLQNQARRKNRQRAIALLQKRNVITNFETDQRNKNRYLNAHSTHTLIAGETMSDTHSYPEPLPEGETLPDGEEPTMLTKVVYKQSVASLPNYAAKETFGSSYNVKGGVSLDGLFRLFSTGSGTDIHMPKFGKLKGSGDVNRDKLNPYTDSDFAYIISGVYKKENDKFVLEEGREKEYRGIALRGPLMVAGWGYDTDDNPVPSKTDDKTQFIEGYKKDTKNWKVGPVDLRWDEDNQLWAAGGGTKFKFAVAKSNIISPVLEETLDEEGIGTGVYKLIATSGLCTIYSSLDDLTNGNNLSDDYVTNFDPSRIIYTGNLMLIFKSSNKYTPVYIGG